MSTHSTGGAALLQGRYELCERLGQGGMGVVWRCFDRDLEEWVAIKFLREEFARDETLRGLFRREVRLARRVTHPNVARVFEFGRAGELFFLTMEYVAGASLQVQLAREGPLAPARLYARAVGLCKGLAAAHAAGVVHGDLKPANVLMARGRGAVLTDFGVARALSEGLAREDFGRGTPVYMAPEQIAGGPMTPQSDVYGVGVLLFEALTGRLPWFEADVISLLAEKTCGRELELDLIAPGLPPAWRELLAACMYNDPSRRPADGRALLGRVGALGRGGEPERARDLPERPAPEPGEPAWLDPGADEVELAAPGWMTGDLIDALTQVHGLRPATRAAGEQPTPVPSSRPPGERSPGE